MFETITSLTDNGDGTLTFIDEAGGATSITLTVDINVNNFSYNNLTKEIILTETDGTIHTIDISDLVDVETITTLVINGDGSATYTSEDGTVTVIPAPTYSSYTDAVTGTPHKIGDHIAGDTTATPVYETLTIMTLNTDGSVSYLSESGATTTIPAPTYSVITDTVPGHWIATHTNGAGVPVNIYETITGIALASNILTYTDEAGVDTTLDLTPYLDDIVVASGALNCVTGILTLTLTDSSTVDIDLSCLIETVTTVTNTIAGNKIATYTNEDGTVYDIFETVTNLTVDLVNDEIKYTQEDGTVQTYSLEKYLPTTSVLTQIVSAGNKIAIHMNGDGTTVDLFESVTTLAQTGNVLTYTNESGTAVNIDLTPYLDNLVVISAAINCTTGIITFTKSDASTFTLDVSCLQETITTLVNTVAGNKIGTYTNEAGAIVDLNETITPITPAFTTGNIIAKYTDEGGTTVELFETITTLVANADGSYTYTAEDGKVTVIPASGAATVYTTCDGTPLVAADKILLDATLATRASGYTKVSDGVGCLVQADDYYDSSLRSWIGGK